MSVTKIKNLFFFALAIIIALPVPAMAGKQYRCEGKVQYRPCNQPVRTYSGNYNSPYRALQNTANRAARAQMRPRLNPEDLYAEIVRSSFKKLPRAEGQWRGVVRGNGTIHLTLQILRNGVPESTRYMGNITLLNDETSFNFISSSPPGKDWTWQVLALAKQII